MSEDCVDTAPHEPLKDRDVAVDADVHLIPELGVRGEVLGEVAHLTHQHFPRAVEVSLHCTGTQHRRQGRQVQPCHAGYGFVTYIFSVHRRHV